MGFEDNLLSIVLEEYKLLMRMVIRQMLLRTNS